jgi:hypothetical protein
MAAYASARGMEPREVLQALVSSMEKTLCKDKTDGPAGRSQLPEEKQMGESSCQPETNTHHGGEGRDLREKNLENKRITGNQGRRTGILPKARWKEELKEGTERLEETQPVGVEDGPRMCWGAHGKDNASGGESKENREGGVSTPEDGNVRVVPKFKRPRSIFDRIGKGSRHDENMRTTTLVACVSGIPRGPGNTGVVQRAVPLGGGSGAQSISTAHINHQILYSPYKFKEGAPLKEYLQQRVSIFREKHRFYKVLTMLNIIIRDNFLFDENNPAMIRGDPPLEEALGIREVYVGEIRDIVYQQLVLLELCRWPPPPSTLTGAAATTPGNGGTPFCWRSGSTNPAQYSCL